MDKVNGIEGVEFRANTLEMEVKRFALQVMQSIIGNGQRSEEGQN